MNARVKTVLDRLYAADAEERAANLPAAQRARNIDRESGRFLSMMVLATGARSVLEIGSSNGVSTIWLASALAETHGHVTGTEIDDGRAAEANRNLAEAGLDHFGKVLSGPANDALQALSGPYDIVVIDAEKDDYIAHFNASFPLVRPRGLIIADNVVSHDLSSYQRMLRDLGSVQTVTLPIERGLELTIKSP